MADSFIDNFEPADEDIEFFEELKNISRQPSCKQKFEEELHAWKCEKRFLEARALHQASCVSEFRLTNSMQNLFLPCLHCECEITCFT